MKGFPCKWCLRFSDPSLLEGIAGNLPRPSDSAPHFSRAQWGVPQYTQGMLLRDEDNYPAYFSTTGEIAEILWTSV